MNNTVLILLFLASAALEIGGILATGKSFIREAPDRPGLKQIHIPDGWEAARGPGIIILGIIVGCAANLLTILG